VEVIGGRSSKAAIAAGLRGRGRIGRVREMSSAVLIGDLRTRTNAEEEEAKRKSKNS